MDLSILDEKWVRVLNVIRTLHPEAIIAGGAIRDSVLGAPVKDIDIFIKGDPRRIDHSTYKTAFDVISRITTAITAELKEIPVDVVIEGLSLTNIRKYNNKAGCSSEANLDKAWFDEYIAKSADTLCVDDSYTGDGVVSNISGVVSFRIGRDIFQLIFVDDDPVDHIDLFFDFNICKAYTDGTTLTLTDEFWVDVDLKFMTLNGSFTPEGLAKVISDHGGRLKQKYPGWTLVIGEISIISVEDIDSSIAEKKNKKDHLSSGDTTKSKKTKEVFSLSVLEDIEDENENEDYTFSCRKAEDAMAMSTLERYKNALKGG